MDRMRLPGMGLCDFALQICAGCALGSTAGAAPPLEIYGRLPAVELVRLSPSADHLAMVGVVGGANPMRRVFIFSGDGKTLVRAIGIGDAKLRDLEWAGDEHLLITTTATVNLTLDFGQSYELAAVINLSLNSKVPWSVFGRSNGIEPTVVGSFGTAQTDGRWYGYFGGITEVRNGAGEYQFEHGWTDLYRVDLESDKTELAAHGSERDHQWAVAAGGGIVAHSEYDEKSGEWRLFAGPHDDRVLIDKLSPIDQIELLGPGRVAGTVLVLDQSGDTDVYEEVNLAAGKSVPLFADYSVTDVRFDPKTRLLIGASTLEEPGEVYFDSELQSRFNSARSAFPGRQVRLESYSHNLERMIVGTSGPHDSGTIWLVNVDAGRAEPIGSPYPQITAADVGPSQIFKYQAADGLAIEGILTLPPGRAPAGLALIVMPHGGPIGIEDRLGFDWWAQAFASRGYAVFQPNYRGSGGYSVAFRQAGYGEWGRKMLSDISDGVAALAKQGLIDPRRACIVGASYGGYAALAGVTIQQGLYRCAVSVSGPADMERFAGWEADRHGYDSSDSRYFRRVTGGDAGGSAALRAISPVFRADKADAPILLIHGIDDTRVPIEQSKQMASALKRAGKPFEFVVLDKEDHFLSRETTRTAMLEAAVAFVEKYDPPQ